MKRTTAKLREKWREVEKARGLIKNATKSMDPNDVTFAIETANKILNEYTKQKMTRLRVLNIRLTDEEMHWLKKLATTKGLSQSSWIRMTIHDAYQNLQNKNPKKEKK